MSSIAMAASREVADIIRGRVPAPGEMVGMTGVTTFIKTELIADGHGRAHVPRPGGKRNGIKVGQRVDNDIRLHVQQSRPLQELQSRKIVRCIREAGLTICAAQVRASVQLVRLTTLVDLVAADADGNIWALEVKNTTLSEAAHTRSYKQQCRRTPTLRNQLMHTECNSHMLQAAFGALALKETYAFAGGRVRSAVIVGTTGKAVLYRVPVAYADVSLFSRRAVVPLSTQKGRSGKPAKKRAALLAWGEGIREDKALEAIGLQRKAGAKRKLVSHVVYRQAKPVGVIVRLPTRPGTCCPKLLKHALSVATVAARAAKRQHPTVPAMARLAFIANNQAIVALGKPV